MDSSIRLGARFLKSILDCSQTWQIENGNLKALLGRLNIQSKDAHEHLQTIRNELQADLDGGISFVFEKLVLMKVDVRDVYNILAHTSKSMLVMADDSHVMDVLEFLSDGIKDLLACRADSVLPVMKELEAADKSLIFLRSFIGFFGKQKDLLTHADAIAASMACLLYLCSVNDEVDDDTAQEMKMKLVVQLEKIKPFQPETRELYLKALKAASESPHPDISEWVHEYAFLVLDSLLENMTELSETKLGSIASFKDQILALHQELKLLKYFIIDPLRKTSYHIQHHEQFGNLCKHIYSLTVESGYVILSLYDVDNDRATKLGAALSNLQAKVEFAKGAARETYDKLIPKLVRSNFPRTNFQGFITCFLQKLEDLAKYSEADTAVPVEDDIEAVQRELLCLKDDFNKIAKIARQHEECNHHWTRFIDVTYRAEYVIELFIAGGCPLLNFKFWLFDVIEDIKMIRTDLNNTQSQMTKDNVLLHEEAKFPHPISPGPDYLQNDESPSSRYFAAHGTMDRSPEIVASNNGEEKIQNQLTSGEEELQIVSIVGLPGIGKTTLAGSVYDSVASCFHIRARVCVSKVYQKRKLFKEFFKELRVEIENLEGKDDEDLEKILRQRLRRRRYLILMDDIWDIQPWLDIKACLPDDKIGSRIVFTSRSHNIASQAGRKSITYQIDLLSNEKSWEMLHSKLFKKNESCPAELEVVGKEIANSCKGLPLTIDLIAGVLRTTERKVKCWQQIAANIKRQIADDPQQGCQKVLERSYNDLPNHLKPCFLYFGAFPEDAEIPAKRLIWLWIAEGFVELQKIDDGLEKAAEAYLDDLVARSLVTASKKRFTGGVRASRVHDLLYDFACIKAREEFFFLRKRDDCTNEPYRTDLGSGGRFGSRRVCSHVRSIHFYHRGRLPFISLIRFRLLRVLDLQYIEIQSLDPAITYLVHLKFISFPADQRELLRLLPRFQHLETVLLVGCRGKGIFSVDNIWNLLRLRHFHVIHCALELPERNAPVENFQLADLQTLSCLYLCWHEETERVMRRLPNLQRLSCAVSDSWDSTKNCNLLPKLDFLKQLYSLKMIYVGKVLHPVSMFSFPPYLKKLNLSEFRLPWSEISTIAELRHLEVLKLRNRAFEGKIWLMRDGDFQKLRVLSLCRLDVAQWDAEEMENNLPHLELLEVLSCKNLKELPSWLNDVGTLKVIRLWPCSSPVEDSAREIVEYQKQLGNEDLEINRLISAETGWNERMEFRTLTWK